MRLSGNSLQMFEGKGRSRSGSPWWLLSAVNIRLWGWKVERVPVVPFWRKCRRCVDALWSVAVSDKWSSNVKRILTCQDWFLRHWWPVTLSPRNVCGEVHGSREADMFPSYVGLNRFSMFLVLDFPLCRAKCLPSFQANEDHLSLCVFYRGGI